MDPNDADHVIVGTDVNLYVTFDGGLTWQPSGGTTTDNGATWTGSNFSGLCGEMIAFDPNNYDHFILGAADGGLWQTWDRGQTFNRSVTDDLGEENVDPGEVFTDFQDGAISYLDSNIIYMIGDLHEGLYSNSGPLFKTTDAGVSWVKIHDGPFNSMVLTRKTMILLSSR